MEMAYGNEEMSFEMKQAVVELYYLMSMGENLSGTIGKYNAIGEGDFLCRITQTAVCEGYAKKLVVASDFFRFTIEVLDGRRENFRMWVEFEGRMMVLDNPTAEMNGNTMVLEENGRTAEITIKF